MTYVFFPSNLCFFLAGSIGYQFYKRRREWIEVTVSSHKWIFLVFGVFVATYDRLPKSQYLYVILIPAVCVMVPMLFAATRSHHLDRLVGELSYPFYLIHLHVLLYMEIVFAHRVQWIFAPTCVTVTLVLSWVFYRFVERRGRSITGKGFTGRRSSGAWWRIGSRWLRRRIRRLWNEGGRLNA